MDDRRVHRTRERRGEERGDEGEAHVVVIGT
jgi:hypothetical protein